MITIDFETTNIRFGTALEPDNRILMVAWKEDDGPAHIHRGDIMDATEFWDAMHRHTQVCAYNIKFEMHWLKRLGFDIDSKKWHDPMLAEKILLGNIRQPMNLGDVCARYGLSTKDKLIDSLMKAGMCPSEMPQKRLMARCVRDVNTTYELFHKTIRKVHSNNQLHLYRNRCDFAVVLTHIEATGMLLDADRVEVEYAKAATAEAACSAELDKLTGGINMKSPDQKAKFLYGTLRFPERKGRNYRPLRNKPSKQFPKGRPKTDKDTLLWLASVATTDKQKRFIELSREYSKRSAALSKNLEFFKGVCEEYGGKFHAQFNQTVAATHRLTSSGMPLEFKRLGGKKKSVQFQNMPREFKKCFKAPDGYVIAEVDAMQLEFRVAAFVGDDPQARKDIDDPDFDAHIFSASKIYGDEYTRLLRQYREGDLLAKQKRQRAKPHTFKPLYGGTRGTPEEERYYASFRERYKHLVAQQENWLGDVMRDGMHTTRWGMRFYWKTYTKPNGMVMDQRTHKPVGPQVFNYPVQNLATAEIVPIAITALYKRCKEAGIDVKFVNTIHDSVICYVKDDMLTMSKFQDAAEWAFTNAVYEHLKKHYNIDFDVPLGMEMVSGPFWGEGKETKYDDAINRRNP